MGDIKDILGISRSASSGPAPRAKQPSIKKPKGMSREVFALLVADSQSSGVPLAPTDAPEEAFKAKRTHIIGWEWRRFNHSGRADAKMEKGLKLGHWQKNNDKSTDYAFARFNKKVKVLSYDDDEYTKHLAHPAWEKAESDLLFELCRRFDLRWPVIHDRFPKGSTPRTMEQLKERYYDMCRKLLAARADADGVEGLGDPAEHPLAKFKYDARAERERKAEFERLYARTEQEVADEVRLLPPPPRACPRPIARPPAAPPARPPAPALPLARPPPTSSPHRPPPFAQVRRLEEAKALEAKLKAQKKAQKGGGKAFTLASLKAELSEQGFGGAEEGLRGLPSLSGGQLDPVLKHRKAEVWLRSKDVSAKHPASDKLYGAFEDSLDRFKLPNPPMATEQVIGLYNTCRAHVVLLTELEAKIKKLEYERSMIAMRSQYPAGAPPPVQPAAAGQKRAGGGGHHAPPGKRRH